MKPLKVAIKIFAAVEIVISAFFSLKSVQLLDSLIQQITKASPSPSGWHGLGQAFLTLYSVPIFLFFCLSLVAIWAGFKAIRLRRLGRALNISLVLPLAILIIISFLGIQYNWHKNLMHVYSGNKLLLGLLAYFITFLILLLITPVRTLFQEDTPPSLGFQTSQKLEKEEIIEKTTKNITGIPEESTQFGGFWIRVGASLLDMMVLIIPLRILQLLTKALPAGNEADILSLVTQILIYIIYFAGLESSVWQATLGKKAAGLKVIGKYGNRISFARAILRFFGHWLSTLTLGIGYLMVVWTEKNRGLHDMIASTYVIKSGNK